MKPDFEKFFEVSLDLLCIAGTDAYFKTINPAFTRLLGWSSKDLLSRPFVDFVHPDDREKTIEEVQKLAAGKNTVSFQNRYQCKNGSYVTIDWNAFPDRKSGLVYATGRDMTETLKSMERFRLAINAAPAAMIMARPDGIIEMINNEAVRMFGYTEDELLGSSVENLLPANKRKEHLARRETYMQHPEPRSVIGRSELRVQHKDGTRFPVEIGLNPIETSDGLRILSVILDLSPRYEVEQMKRHFTASVSHELRTPMTSIYGALCLLARGTVGTLPKNALDLAKLAQSNCERMMRLLDDILDMDKVASGTLTVECASMDLAALIEQVCEECRPMGQSRSVSIDYQTALKHCPITGDADRLNQAVTNLLSNAIKFSPEEETVKVVLSEQPDTWRLEVIDHGPGIPEEFQPQVFEAFTQARGEGFRQKGSSGLGLAITKNLVEQHGGTIDFTTSSRGTTFFIELPREP